MKFPTISKFAMVLFVTLCVTACLFKSPLILKELGLNLSLFQIVVFPFFMLLLLQWRLFNITIPRGLLGVAALLAVVTVACSFVSLGSDRRTVVIARLEGDDFEIATRLFKEKVKAELTACEAGDRIKLARHFSSLPVRGDPRKFWEANRGPLALIWGNQRWLGVSFDPDDAVFMPVNAFAAWKEKTGLQPVATVSWLGLSFKPEDETARFLAALFAALPLSNIEGLLAGDERFNEVAMALEEVADMRSHWTLFAHTAYPYWLLGNLHLAKAVQKGGLDSAALEKAQRFFLKARANLKPRDNPELYVAIVNNAGLGHYVQGVVEQKKTSRKFAAREFQAAARFLKNRGLPPAVYAAAGVAKSNLDALRRQSGQLKVNRKKRPPSGKRPGVKPQELVSGGSHP